jgi:hypothetical protein
MKRFLIVAALVCVGSTVASAQSNNSLYGSSSYGTGSNPNSHYVSPYTNSLGTTVQGHYQTNSNSTQYDNYNTRENLNPHTGSIGTRSPQY